MSELDTSKFLILGANGQLGKALRSKYPDARYADSKELDITHKDSLASYDWTHVTHILNAAAYTNVDGAESTEGRRASWAINAGAVSNLAELADENSITLVHISSDYVFDGSTDVHTEDESFSPLSVYGASKAAGDIAASHAHCHYILRTSWVIGDGSNFVRTMMSLAKKDISPTVVHDQVGRLTFTTELVKAIDHLLQTGANFGTYNVTNSGDSVSWADITRFIYTTMGCDDLSVSNTTTAEYFAGKEGIAPRPLQSTLSLRKIEETGYSPADWKDNLKVYIQEQTS